MSIVTTCPRGHRFKVEGTGPAVCPECGAAVVAQVASTDTADLSGAGVSAAQAVTLAPEAGVGQDAPSAETLMLPGYEVLEEVGRGGMGVVYKARQIELRRTVAIKMILAGIHAGSREMARFHREAQVVARLEHPHIVKIYDMGEHEGQAYLTLEYVDGGTLAQLLKGKPIPPAVAATLVRKLARAVQYAHEQGIVHRDLKPANVLLATPPSPGSTADTLSPGSLSAPSPKVGEAHPLASFEPKVADFGLAKILDTDQGQTQSGALLGTPAYIAPEQAGGKVRQIGPAADVYALGVILYELLTGRPPFLAETAVDTVLLVLSQEPATPRALARHCPRDLETICLKCLQKEPDKRYATAQELADDLGRYLAGEPIRARRTPLAERLWRRVRRHPLRAACLMLGLAALLLAGWQFAPSFYRQVTHQGQLVLETPEPAVTVRLEKDGSSLELAANQVVTLPAGDYALTLIGGPGGLELEQERMTVAVDDRQVVRVRPTAEGMIRKLEGHKGPVHSVAISPDGRWALSASGFPLGDQTLRLWDLRAGKEERILLENHNQMIAVTFSPDGKHALSGGTDSIARLWEIPSGRLVREYRGHTAEILVLTFSADGKRFLSAGHDHTIRLWDVSGEQSLMTFTGHTGSVLAAVFLPDGRVLSAAHDSTIRTWDPATGKEVGRRIDVDCHGIECLKVIPGGWIAAATSFDRCIRLWDIKTGRLLRRLIGHSNVASTLDFSPDGRFLVSGSMDHTVRLWDVASGTELYSFEIDGHIDGIRGVAFAPDGWHVLSGGGGNRDDKSGWTKGSDYALRWWGLPHTLPTPDPPTPRAVEVGRLLGHNGGVHEAILSPDGQRLLSSGKDRKLRFWNVGKGQEDSKPIDLPAETFAVAWSPDGKRVLTGGDDGMVRLWDVQGGTEVLRCPGHKGRVWSVAYSADSRFALSGGDDKSVRLWDLATGKEHGRFLGHQAMVRRVALSPDGRYALSCSSEEKEARLWDLRQAFAGKPQLATRELPLLKGHTQGVQCVAFSADGKKAISGGKDLTVRVWDLANRSEDRPQLMGQVNWIERVAFSPDGRRILSGSWDGTVVCWDVESGREVAFCGAHSRIVTSVRFAPEGRFITCSDQDPVIRLWQLPESGRTMPPELPLPDEQAAKGMK